MSQKNLSPKFNAYAGKIVNLAEFEITLEALNSLNLYQGFFGLVGAAKDLTVKQLTLKQKDPGFPIPWPTIYTADTTAEVEQASAEGKPVKIAQDKIYFEASSLLTTLKAYGALSSSFKKSVEISADHRELLAQNTLSSIEGNGDLRSYTVGINHGSHEVNLSASVIPKAGFHKPAGTTWLSLNQISQVSKTPKKFGKGY